MKKLTHWKNEISDENGCSVAVCESVEIAAEIVKAVNAYPTPEAEHEAERTLWLNAMKELRVQNTVLRNLLAMVLEDARDYGETNPAKVSVSTINRIRAELAEPITDG